MQRLPTEIKVLKGTAQKCRENPAEPKPEVVLLKPPTFLTAPAKKAFKELARITKNMRVLTEGDEIALTMLCEAWAEWREMQNFLKKNDKIYQTKNKLGEINYKPRPEVAILNNAHKKVLEILREFGLTPAARAKVNTAAPEENNPLNDYFND